MGDVAADGKPVILLVGVKLEHPLLASGHPSFKQEDVAKSVRQNLHAVQRYMDEHGYELTLLLCVTVTVCTVLHDCKLLILHSFTCQE